MINVVVKIMSLWKSHNLDKWPLGTYMRVIVFKGIAKCTFILNQAMNFFERQLVRSK